LRVAGSIDLLGLLIAALGGAAVGLERQRSGHAQGPRARFAGIRTFTLLGGIGGLSGALWNIGLNAPAVVLLAGAMSLIAAAYVRASRTDVDGTTEVAAVVVVAAGLLSGIGSYRIASAVIALTSLLLIEKSRLHALAARIDDVELRAGVRFAVLALVVLPVLPQGPYGPLGGVRPRLLWALVLFFSGFSFVAYVARKAAGPRRGYLLAGLLGGLASSTNVTFTFARRSRQEPEAEQALGYGAVAGNAMLYPRVLAAVCVLNLPLAFPVFRYLLAPALIASAVTIAAFRKPDTKSVRVEIVDNPLQLRSALQMALLFQVVLMLVYVVRRVWGEAGVLTSAAVLGLTDVDALTLSVSRDAARSVSLQTAAAAIAIGVTANTVLKLGVAMFLGSRGFRKIAGGTLFVMTIAAVASLLLIWLRS
jgi:uncharacterized membrane protein (DUF4010 family)